MKSVIEGRVNFFQFYNSTHDFSCALKEVSVNGWQSEQRWTGIKGVTPNPFGAALSASAIGGLKDCDAMSCLC
jgi:hypothetical protein